MSEIDQKERLKQIGLGGIQEWPREQRVLKNTYWYNERPSLAGYGDIRLGAAQKVARTLIRGEFMAFMPSYAMTDHDNKEERPPIDFIAQNFGMLIVPKYVYVPNHPDERVDFPVRLETEHTKLGTQQAAELMHEILQQ